MSNLNGPGVIAGIKVYKGRDCADTYARTPVFDAESIPNGKYAHIGGAVWRKVCRACPAYVDNYGAVQWLPELAHHERAHGLDVVGVNIAMLP